MSNVPTVPKNAIVRFDEVSFEYAHNKPILHGASFVVRRGAKFTLMGQNGAGKSTIFGLITGKYTQSDGEIHKDNKVSIAEARQIIPRDELSLTVRDFFQNCFTEKVYDIEPRITRVLDVVNMPAVPDVFDRTVGSFSGGQQARILLASALIQEPDLLLLDEPTNNLDTAGIEHLITFLKEYKKTVLVISHDADFLNSFTDGVIYLDVHTHVAEQYDGNYNKVVRDITARIEKENRENARYAKEIQANKDKANFFAQKGGGMRLVAKKMREKAEEFEESKVEVRREDRTIRPFTIPVPDTCPIDVLKISSYTIFKNHKPKTVKAEFKLRRGDHMHIIGPNGIGKSTLLESFAGAGAGTGLAGEEIAPEVKVGYYRQDFSMLDFDATVFDYLMNAAENKDIQEMRSLAAGFLLFGDVMGTKIGNLSEGQKGLVAFAELVLKRPSLLILDEPTNHINFRHLPVIAKALSEYEGAMIIVSHMQEFVKEIRIDTTLDLGRQK